MSWIRLLPLLALSACVGDLFIGGASTNETPTVTPKELKPVPLAPTISLRRLTRVELDNSLARLTLDTHHRAYAGMPGEALAPFDNASETQLASAVWVEAAERVAEQVAADILASPSRRAALVPCTPMLADDPDCLGRFVRQFGRRVLRRPLTAAEVTQFMSLRPLALQRGNFWTCVELVIRRLLQDPEFLFRFEVGTTGADGVIQLDPFEVASRTSFLIQGSTPPNWLLDAAEAGTLSTPEQLRAAASRLLEEPEGRARVEVFHAMWLGYTNLPPDQALNASMMAETSALVRKVVFEDRADYRTLFTAQSTWVDATLAAHYGLAVPVAGSAWTSYGNSGRKGILSHGALLSNGVKQADTSPTLRGKWIRNRLFCEEIPPPPPEAVADVPPPAATGVVCKVDRYREHRTATSCAGCHGQMDPIGFGLEQFDRAGKFRDREADHPECLITGDGTLTGFGSFRGPAGLADLMISSGALESCVVKQLFRYTVGRRENADDGALISTLTGQFTEKGRRFDLLVLDLVAQPTFTQRREAP